jgi:hypothetical protein
MFERNDADAFKGSHDLPPVLQAQQSAAAGACQSVIRAAGGDRSSGTDSSEDWVSGDSSFSR